jgi:hypothetical protein
MKLLKKPGWFWLPVLLIFISLARLWSDGGYVSKTESVAISADQRAILIKNSNEISMTFSTGYSGDGEDFGWIIPTPIPPSIEDVSEASENVKFAFEVLQEDTAPVVPRSRSVVDAWLGFQFAEAAEDTRSPRVLLYGTVVLEHYEVSVVTATDTSALLEWLQTNKYQVNPGTRNVLEFYVKRNWSFVAVKLNPSEQRQYENEFLTPLIIKYQYDQLIFPLYISSISTTGKVKLTLFVLTESTVESSNFSTKQLQYEKAPGIIENPQEYVENCISRTIGPEGNGLALIWSGNYQKSYEEEGKRVLGELMKTPFQSGQEVYLTRLESRMGPAAMIEDIYLILDPRPRDFAVRAYPELIRDISIAVKAEPAWIFSSTTWPGGFSATLLLSTILFPKFFPPAIGLDVILSKPIWKFDESYLVGVEASVYFLASVGLSCVWEMTATDETPYLGFRVRLFDFPPIPVGFDILPLTVRWNIETGEAMFTVGLISISGGYASYWW